MNALPLAVPQDPVQAVADEITAAGGRATAFEGDLSSQAAAEACVQTAVGQFGQLNILGNNAGTFLAVSELDEYSVQAFKYLVKNNIYITFHMGCAARLAEDPRQHRDCRLGIEADGPAHEYNLRRLQRLQSCPHQRNKPKKYGWA